MIVQNSIIFHSYTTCILPEDIPRHSYYMVYEGKKHEMIPVYGISLRAFAIKGEFELTGQEIFFAGREDGSDHCQGA